jgi:hypothetical protein
MLQNIIAEIVTSWDGSAKLASHIAVINDLSSEKSALGQLFEDCQTLPTLITPNRQSWQSVPLCRER